MKRLFSAIAILCVLAMVLSATGCGEPKKPEPATTATEAATEAVTEEAAEAETEAATEAPTEAETEEAAEAPAEAETEAAPEAPEDDGGDAAADGLVPEIVIEFGDYDGIVALGQDAANMKIAEGTVVQISGISNKGISNPSVMEDNGEGTKKGVVMIIEGEWEAPQDGTEIDVIGTFVKGQFAMEYHVLAENIIVK